MQYVRVTPYNKRSGALASRVVVGGKLFQSGKWYRMPEAQAAQIAPLKQGTGAPYFEICSEEQFNETARRELAAAMAAAGLTGLAMGGAQELPKAVPAPTTGPRKSGFAGLEKKVAEVDPTQPLPAEEPEAPAEAAPPPDLDSMTKAELLNLASDLGVAVPSGASNARLRALLREHV
jgi:hypothetical protein